MLIISDWGNQILWAWWRSVLFRGWEEGGPRCGPRSQHLAPNHDRELIQSTWRECTKPPISQLTVRVSPLITKIASFDGVIKYVPNMPELAIGRLVAPHSAKWLPRGLPTPVMMSTLPGSKKNPTRISRSRCGRQLAKLLPVSKFKKRTSPWSAEVAYRS